MGACALSAVVRQTKVFVANGKHLKIMNSYPEMEERDLIRLLPPSARSGRLQGHPGPAEEEWRVAGPTTEL